MNILDAYHLLGICGIWYYFFGVFMTWYCGTRAIFWVLERVYLLWKGNNVSS